MKKNEGKNNEVEFELELFLLILSASHRIKFLNEDNILSYVLIKNDSLSEKAEVIFLIN